jgi:hypothetical protein
MPSLEIDVTDVLDEARRAGEAFEQLRPRALRIAKGVATEERQSHEYRNRTGDLQRSTEAKVYTDDATGLEIIYGAYEEYASYVEDRGLSRVTELWDDAQADFDFMVEDIELEIIG